MSLANPTNLYLDVEYLGSAESYVDDVLAAINKEALFDEFYRYEIEELCQFMHCFSAPAGTVLLQEGEEGDHLILLLSGQVIVRKTDLAGKPHSLALVGEGSILGEMSLIDGQPRFASCIAAEATRFAVLSKSDLNEIMALHPRLANKFLTMLLQIMVERLRDLGTRVVSPATRPLV
ncbi:MAG: Crp/Fnr family transcriptional regulator [Pseudomonadota bacterium]|nr:cyclic nucleotide-binding domain-containing protein [Rhodocyclaceae bacterium]